MCIRDRDSKVYKYYKEIIADYNNIKNDNVAFTAEKLTKTYEQYKDCLLYTSILG